MLDCSFLNIYVTENIELILSTYFHRVNFTGNVGALGWWDLFINFG